MPTEDSRTPPRETAGGHAPDDGTAERERQLRFVRRIHRFRSLGLGLGFVCVGSVFRLHDAPVLWWLLLAAYTFAWPHVARSLAVRSAHPMRTELRHLTLDSALGGAWVGLMQFNLLPSVVLVTMLSVDKIAVGGARFAARTTAVLVGGCALTTAMLGFPVAIATPMPVIVACLPLLVAYPLVISNTMHVLASKVAQRNTQLAQLSHTDELTGLANRRHGFAVAAQLLAGHRRDGRPAVLVVLDIDRFKDANDRYGHPAGDQILREVAAMLRRCTRATDTPARYAGDEFLLVLPDTDLAGAAEMAWRIRDQLAATEFTHAPGLRCTVSLGAAEVYRDMVDIEDWIQQADAALYRAKAAGRDCLVCAPKIPPQLDRPSGERVDAAASATERPPRSMSA